MGVPLSIFLSFVLWGFVLRNVTVPDTLVIVVDEKAPDHILE